MHFAHSGESISITYKKDGRYIPGAMKKLNYFLRDWRRDAVTHMDPRVIDLVWELHEDLGSKVPVEIISGYRSATTNAMLKRIGRHVARRSMHIHGKAMDVYFPDVPLARLRGSALVRKIGGVGYYPRSGKGFVHVDTGRVRHWPRVSPTRMASILSRYKNTVGARLRRNPIVLVASANQGTAAAGALRPRKKPAFNRVARVVVPKPRPRPLEVLMMAAAEIRIQPASAPVPKVNFAERRSLVRDPVAGGVTINGGGGAAAPLTTASIARVQTINRSAKGSFAAEIRSGNARNVAMVSPLTASMAGMVRGDMFAGTDWMIRRDGAPRRFVPGGSDLPVVRAAVTAGALNARDKSALQRMIAALLPANQVELKPVAPGQVSVTSGKGDRLEVNRTAKGNLKRRVRRRFKRTSLLQ